MAGVGILGPPAVNVPPADLSAAFGVIPGLANPSGPVTASGVTGNTNPAARQVNYGIPLNPALGNNVNVFGYEGSGYQGYGGYRPEQSPTFGVGDPLLQAFGMLINGLQQGK